MKVLFVIPKNKSMLGHDYSPPGFPNIGVAYLATFLKQHGHEISVFDGGLHNEESLSEKVSRIKPQLVGVTSFSYCYEYARQIINEVKRASSAWVVLGGPHVSVAKSAVLRDSTADFAIKREGEYSLLELLSVLERNTQDFSSIGSLIWRDGNQIIENSEASFIADLDQLPIPDYSMFDIKQYVNTRERSIPIITSRGCPYECTYCATLLSMGRGFRRRTAENVFREIQQRYDEGYRYFDINDDCFTLDINRAKKICDLIIEHKLDILLQCYNGIRVDRITPELLQKMRQAGFYFLAFGCESGNAQVLKTIKKSIGLDQVRNAVTWARNAGIDCAVNFIIGHPGETYEQALDTLAFAKSLNCNYVNFSNLIPYPGTQAFEEAQKHGRFLISTHNYLSSINTYDDNPIFETDEFTAEQRKEVMTRGHEYYYKRILMWRLGTVLGTLVYYATRLKFLRNFASNFAINNRFGRSIFIFLSGRSRDKK